MTLMQLPPALRRLAATHCPECRGQGHRMGLFHPLPCSVCGACGYVQADTGQLLDTLAMAIIANAKTVDARAARQKRAQQPNRGTPDNWTLRGNFRGD